MSRCPDVAWQVEMQTEWKCSPVYVGAMLRDDFRQNPTDVVVAAGEPAILECQPPRGHPEPTIYWKKDKIRIDDKEERISIRGGKLMISNTRKSDAGMYTCVGTNMVGERDSDPAELTVFERPTFLRRPINQVVLEEEAVEFRCQVQGDPQPTVRWKKDDADLPRGRYDIKDDYTLRIKKAMSTDEGTYMCIAENRVGKVEASATLTVRAPPQFVVRPRDQIVAQGRTVTFPCETKGNPQPAVFWQKEGSQNLLFPNQPQQPNSRCSVSPTGDLTITNIQRSDAGYYICQALTVAGSILAKAQLEVTDESGATISKNYDLNDLPGPPSKPQVTDVTKNSVTLSWQPGIHLVGCCALAKGYHISWAEFNFVVHGTSVSQSVSNSWQTVANHVKTTLYTVRGLRPNTIYLFMVRAINPQGLSDPSAMSDPVRTQDISPPAQGVDHRQVQKELGDVIVRLHTPVVLTPTTVQVTWTVDRQPQFIQGYRVMYRQTSGLQAMSTWQNLDAKVPTERSAVLVNLKKGVTYEIKVRPYFNEFQGMDSDAKTVRTTEEAPSAPPQSVTVLTVGSHNSTSISVSWDPPPPDHQNGIIQEYKIWCLGNETRFHINKTVDAAIRSVIIGGLFPGIQYRVEVAASTSAGVGVKSEPQPIIVGGRNEVVITENNNSITEQITDVVKQPAFIAGIGGACWVILMGFSIWLYWRRKKRKGLSNYADVLPPVPGQGDKTATMLSDGAIYSSIDFTTKTTYNSSSQITQATPYATTQILHSNSIHELAVDLPDPQWKSSIQQKTDLMGFGYSLPDQNKGNNALLYIPDYRLAEGLSNRMPHNQSQDFSTTSSHNSSERSGSLSGGKGGKKKKNKNSSKPQKNNGSTWANVPLPPPPVQPLPGTELEHYAVEQQENGYDSDSWCPPLPVQTYLHQGMEDELEEDDDRVPTPPVRGVASSPAVSFGQQSTATLTPSPREEMQPMLQAHLDELTRAYQFDIAKQTWHVQSNNQPPQPPVPPLGYMSGALISDLETDVPDDDADDEEEVLELPRPLRALEQTPGSSMDNLDSSVTGSMVNGWGSASDEDRNFSSHRSSVGSSSDGSIFASGSFAQALVAAADKAGFRLEGTSLTRTGKAFTSSQRPRPTSPFSTDSNTSAALSQSQRPRPTKKHKGGRVDPQPALPHRREGLPDDLPPPPDPPPGQGLRQQIGPSQHAGNVENSTERKGSSLERQQASNLEDTKSSLDCPAKTSLEWQRQTQEWINCTERQEDTRKALHKQGVGPEETLVPYSKPSFPSPGGHSSSGTASSKGSTGPRKAEPLRGSHQRNASDLLDIGYMGSNSQGQFTGEL
ncbi:roundabout 2 precursor, partial [Camelus ferus]